MKTVVSLIGCLTVLIGLDLCVMAFAFFMGVIDAAFGDAQGANFWIGFLAHWPTPMKYLP